MINEIKGQKLRQSNTDTFVTSGTLGDMYIVLCKLFDYHRRTGKQVRLIRYCSITELDGAINQLFNIAPYIELQPCHKTASHDETVDCIKDATKNFAFISPMWDTQLDDSRFASADKTLEDYADPKYITMDPFPTLDIPVRDLGEDIFHIGIQLHCGSVGRNFRGFSLEWVAKLSHKLRDLKVTIHILGTGDGYEKSELKQLSQIPNMRNWVGETSFSEWLSLMKSMDAFIALEGFPAFFAMSQKVSTILYDQFSYGILIHPLWRKDNVIVNLNSNVFVRKKRYWKVKYLKQKNLYSPSNWEFIRSFIAKNLKKGATQ